ncbi:MAG: BrxA family protein [Gaiella sp.]
MYTANIQKGGALLDDARRFVEVWDEAEDVTWNLGRIADQNLLAKPSRARSADVIRRVLVPRLVEPGPQVIASLKELLVSPRSFVDAYYFEASRDDKLLAAVTEGPLFGWWESGRVGVDVNEIVAWLDQLAAQGKTPPWTETIRVKVARGLLAALRDFGILTGAVRKEFARPSLSTAGFAYVAFRLHETGSSSRATVLSSVWRRWLLDNNRVTELFHEAARAGLLRYSSAGSSVRVDWLQESLPEVVRAAA